ncbi:PucR family transcriptional regulator [Krasilnikovia sp. MM14-A1259]|uniref:PucR family transcriptional regulator n=1 Tax=Krasilnikovia sp. MM14-A1259 TaxID=3373539 RepID=UPI00399C6293
MRERDASIRTLLDDLVADGRILDEMVEVARSRSPEVARLPHLESRRHIQTLLSTAVGALDRLGELGDRDFTQAARLGAERAAQGVPIGALLYGVQACRSRALEIVVSHGRAAGIPDEALLEAVLDVDRYAATLERHVIEGYRAAERRLGRGHREARSRMLRRLLLGEHGGVPPHELARFGLRADGRYHCVLAELGDVTRVSPVEQSLSALGAVVGTVDGRLAALAPRLPPAEALGRTVPAVAAPARRLTEIRAVYGLCLTALRTAIRSGLAGLHDVVDLAAQTALTAQPLLAELLRDSLLGALRPGDDFHRELVTTALGYLDHGLRLDQTAAALHVHPNTVRYRLRRLHEITGIPALGGEPGERPDVLETTRLWWALRTWLTSTSAPSPARLGLSR